MSMNFEALKNLFLQKIRETATNGTWDETQILRFFNEIYQRINTDEAWPFYEKSSKLTNPYTEVADTSTGTTLKVDSITDMFQLQDVVVFDGTLFEYVNIGGAVTTTTLTLTDPGLSHSWDDGDGYVAGVCMQLPSDFYKIDSILWTYISSGSRYIGKMSPTNRQRVRKDMLHHTYGNPEYYYISGDYLYIAPVPDRAYTIELDYYRRIDDLTNSDTPELPEEFHKLIAWGGAALALNDDGQFNASDRIMQEYYNEYGRIRARYFEDEDEGMMVRLFSENRGL